MVVMSTAGWLERERLEDLKVCSSGSGPPKILVLTQCHGYVVLRRQHDTLSLGTVQSGLASRGYGNLYCSECPPFRAEINRGR